MSRHSWFAYLSVVLLFVLLLSLASPMTVHAEDGVPPPVTEEPSQPPTDVPVVEEAALATETPVATDEPTLTEANNVLPIADGEAEGTNDKPVAASEDEEPSVAEALKQLPEDTALVVLDETGDALPLATEAASEALATSDPYFTLGGITYGFTSGLSCPVFVDNCATGIVAPIQAAINYLDTLDATPDDNTIFVEADTYSENVVINGSLWTSRTLGDLILSGAGSHSTTITGTLEAYNLTGSFTLQGFTFTNWGYLQTSGDVHVNDVIVRNTDYGLDIHADGNITVTDSAFYDSNGVGLKIYAPNGNVTLDRVTAQGNGREGADISAIKGNVTVSNSIFEDNSWTGLNTYSPAGSTTLNNVVATRNGYNGTRVNAAGDVSVTSSFFDRNKWNGLEVISNGSVTLNDVIATQNAENGADVSATGDVSATSSHFDDNIWTGLDVASSGSITLNDVSASGNGTFGASINANSLDTMDVVTITDSIFEDNDNIGLSIYSRKGVITLDTVTANWNGYDGVDVDASGNLSVICSEFKHNKAYGLDASEVDGSLTLGGVTFADNPDGGYAYDDNATLMDVICNPVPPTDPVPSANPVSPTGGASDGGKDKDALLYTVTAQSQDQLPGALGAGNTFRSALKVILSDQGAQTENLLITLVFPILEGMEDDNLSVMFWDGAAWLAAPGGSVVNGFFVITVSRPGVYVLVSR